MQKNDKGNGFIAKKLELGEANALVKILGGMGIIREILRGNATVTVERAFPVFLEVEVGRFEYKSPDEVVLALLNAGMTISSLGVSGVLPLTDFTIASGGKFVRISPRAFGVTENIPYTEFLALGLKHFDPCSSRDAPDLRLTYADQPIDEELLVMVHAEPGKRINTFNLVIDDKKPCLMGVYARANLNIAPDDQGIFRLRAA